MSYDLEKSQPNPYLRAKADAWLDSAAELAQAEHELRGYGMSIQAAEIVLKMMPDKVGDLAELAEARAEVMVATDEDILRTQLPLLPNLLAHMFDDFPGAEE